MRILGFDSLDSSQDECFRLIDESSEKPPFAVWARNYHALRGRRGRHWIFEPGASLAFSFAFEAELHQLNALSLIVGLSLHDCLEISELQIKWPNDLMLKDQKVGGVLVETRIQSKAVLVVVGIGINLKDLKQGFLGIQKKLEYENFIPKFFELFKRRVERPFLEQREEFEKLLWKKGERAQYVTNSAAEAELFEIVGVTDEGALKLRDGKQLRVEVEGEIVHESLSQNRE